MEGTSPHVAQGMEEAAASDKAGSADAAVDKAADLDGAESPNGEVGGKPKVKITKAEPTIYSKRKEIEIPDRPPVEVNLRTLLQAGVHFGHQTSRWSPAMAPYIHSSRNGIHIVNLPHTLQAWEQAREVIVKTAAAGGNVLFVGTKKQAADAVVQEARRCGAFYVSRRWLGGMITNFQTIRKSIERLAKLLVLPRKSA